MNYGGNLWEYDASHPHALDKSGGVDRYDYNANGSMVVRNKGAANQQALKWDGANQLASVTATGLSESYLYDENGQLLRKQTGTGLTTYYAAGGFEQTNGVISKHYFFNGQAIAVRTGSGTGSGIAYLYHDRVGSTIHVTSQSGGYVASRGYYAYGETRRTDGAMPSDRRYTGQPESATGLYYYGARWYDPAIGQFVSPDTLVPDESSFLDYNRYLYAKGNPLKYNDPSGHCPTDAPDNDDEKAAAEFRECWTLVGQVAAMYDSDSWWQDRFKVDKDTFITKLATLPTSDSKWLTLQLTTWRHDFEQRTGLPTGKIDWRESPDFTFPQPEIIGLIGGKNACEVWDCVALGLDVASIGVQLSRDAGFMSTPVTGPFGVLGGTSGAIAQNSISIAGFGWTVKQMQNGNASYADLAVVSVTGVAGNVPVVGEFSSGAQLLWDLVDPLVPW